MKKCREWLQQRPDHPISRKAARDMTRVYHWNTAKADKEKILADFKKPGDSLLVRIIFATEALGLGIDLPDIQQVVLYGLPRTLEPSILWQRGGRACQDGQEGEVIILFEQWVSGCREAPPKPAQKDETLASVLADEVMLEVTDKDLIITMVKTPKATDAQRWGALPPFWYDISNSEVCLQKLILAYFGETLGPQEPI